MPKKVSDIEKKQILESFTKGLDIKEISGIYNYSPITIRKQLKNMLGESKFISLKNKSFQKDEFKDQKDSYMRDFEKKKTLSDIKSKDEIDLEESFENKFKNNDEIFYEILPINDEFEFDKQKDLTSEPLENFNFPKIVYMIVNKKIELQIKYLKDYPDWQFLSKDELSRKTIEIYVDLKNAKRYCNKEEKVIKVPNTEVFKIVAPVLLSRGISRIVSSDKLISL